MAEKQSTYERIGLTRGKAVVIGVLAIVLVGVISMQLGGPDWEETGAARPAPAREGPRASQVRGSVDPAGGSDTVIRGSPGPARAGSVGSPVTTTRSPATTPSPPEPREGGLAVEASLAAGEAARWTAPELSHVIAYDPFALPAAFPQPPVVHLEGGEVVIGAQRDDSAAEDRRARAHAQLRSQLAALQERGVHAIVNQRDEYVAMIDGRTLQVGDEIEGFIITAIDPDGVQVEKRGLE